MSKENIKKYITIGVTIIALLLCSFVIYNKVNADSYSNEIAMQLVTLTGIDTGGNNSSDGLDYSNAASYTKIDGYTAGSDSKTNNRIVRSFDALTYHFNFSISAKQGSRDYEERKVTVKVTIPEELSKYISFKADEVTNTNTYTYTFDGIDSYGTFAKDVTLYVLGAPNGTLINPKFEIQESTNTDSNYLVTLGNISGNTNNYRYDRDRTTPYSTTPTVQGFTNYMPTIVSSKKANLKFKVLGQADEGQKATYNNKVGRYLTYVVGLEMEGTNDTDGIKGFTMPTGDVTYNINTSQNGTVNTVTTTADWTRLYGIDSVSGIDPVVVSLPYSATNIELSKRTKAPGTITFNGTGGTISGYSTPYSPVTVNADGSAIPKREYVIGTYAFSMFSERSSADGKNPITTTFTISGSANDTTPNSTYTISPATATLVNNYYENIDYSLTGAFYDDAGNKISEGNQNGKGAISKGTTLIYKTTFNYKKTLSEQGLKEIIKFDPNAYRVTALGNKQVRISATTADGTKLKEDDFEVKFVSGDWNKANYSPNTSRDRIASEELGQINSSCSTTLNYTLDQMMNLYGGPCIKAITENEYESVYDAKIGDKEDPITKVIVQTKEGVVLPDVTTVTIEVGVRVRNVSDLTQTYQATAVATSSDYDSVLTYYAPRVTSDRGSITNPDNYMKTLYQGNNIQNGYPDANLWGDCLKIVNYTSREIVTVTNKNKDGTTKINYNSNKGETINYNVKTIINDNNEAVGADDVWWINHLKVTIKIPSELEYIPDDDLGKPEVTTEGDKTVLIYDLPYTKPNQKIPEINFKTKIKPTLRGTAKPLTVTSTVDAININGEKDTSYFGYLTGSFTIYATGLENVIVSQKIGEEGSVVEKNSEFSYLLEAYNNTNSNITDYNILDILPSSNDENGSSFSGNYKVKVTLPASQGNAKVLCSKQSPSKIVNEVMNNDNEFEECDILDSYVEATAIKITDISLNSSQNMDAIKVSIKPNGNNYEDKYRNSFVGGSRTYSQNESNVIEARVISRNISGRVFVDINENAAEDKGDTYLKDIPLTLYKLDSENNMKKIEDTVTNENGYYKFKNLDVGRYKIRASYDAKQYDLTLRYGTEDRATDSDAYKIEEGVVEISNYKTPDESEGIKVTREVESVSDMNIGLISLKSFGFIIDKYITKVDLTYNGSTVSKDYPNLKLVKEDVKNSWRASSKVYYGIKIENNSNSAGYVKSINESIPFGATFDATDPVNAGWVSENGTLKNLTLQDDVINPGESRYITIALNIPPQEQAQSYVNTVNIETEKYDPELTEDKNADSLTYSVGESVNYAGVSWHVISTTTPDSNGAQNITLLADDPIPKDNNKAGTYRHTNSTSAIYKWSDSEINKFINSDEYVNTTTLNPPILVDANICDDASGMPVASYGGTISGPCQSGIRTVSKIRLLTEDEWDNLNAVLTNKTWFYGNSDYWLQNSVFVSQNHTVYGVVTNDSTNLAKYFNKSTNSISAGASNASKGVRPVITISNKNIIPE